MNITCFPFWTRDSAARSVVFGGLDLLDLAGLARMLCDDDGRALRGPAVNILGHFGNYLSLVMGDH